MFLLLILIINIIYSYIEKYKDCIINEMKILCFFIFLMFY